MKKTLSIIVIVLFLISLCVIEEILVNKTLGTVHQKATSLLAFSSQKDVLSADEILSRAQDLQDFWEKHEEYLCFFVNHKDMQNMGYEITNLISFAATNSRPDYFSSLNTIIYYSQTFHHIMGVSFQNII